MGFKVLSMPTHQILTLEDAEMLLRGHVGLICGPGLSKPEASFSVLATMIARAFKGIENGDYFRNGQDALRQGAKAEDVKALIRKSVSEAHPSEDLKRVASVKWSAVVSLSLDSAFEAQLRRAVETRASGVTLTEVTTFPQVLPQKTIPAFKLLGTLDSDNFAFSETTYALRRGTWRHALRDFADRVKDGPVFCLGLKDCLSMIYDVIAELVAESRTVLTPLIFLAEEFDASSRTALDEVTGHRTKIAFVDASLANLITRLKDFEKVGSTPPLVFQRPVAALDRLAPFGDLIAIVNAQITSPIAKEETAQLLDLLFSPDIARWDSFHHNLDFRRSVSMRILDLISRPVRQASTAPAFLILGGAASGKTTIAKRVAYDLVNKGHFVMWFRRAFYPNIQSILSEFFRVLAEVTDKTKRLFFFIDDPVGHGSTTVRTISAIANAKGVKCTFVLIVRTSDWHTHDHTEVMGDLDLLQEFQIDNNFDDQELQALPNYLVSLNIFPTKDAARAEIERAPSRSASDTLGLLYWLLPKTRQSIESSIQQEYVRLGETAGLSRVIIGAYQKTTDFLRRAYGLVAVSDHYHVPVPIEVLVSAIEIPYRDWLSAVEGQDVAWGLFYREPSPNEDTEVYRPRNSIVTRILVETINGGKLGHGGEVQYLRDLLTACSGTSPIYRQFCIDILVPRSKLSDLEYQDGLQLYDAAIDALPLPDRTLKHQKGLWIKDKGNDPLLAKTVLEDALITNVYPYTSRGEADEHIHTSIAASIVDAVDLGKIPLSDAVQQVLRHVDQARSDSFFNTRAVHVQARLVLRLLSKFEDSDTADIYALVNQALGAVDSTLLMLRDSGKSKQPAHRDIEFLETVTSKIFEKIIPLDELRESAEELFRKFNRQDGFVIAARKLYQMARDKNSGTAFNEAFSYCQEKMTAIQEKGQTPSSDLCAIAVCIYYQWYVVRYESNKNVVRQIDWSLLCDLARTVLRSERYKGDPFYRFTAALALAQTVALAGTGNWGDVDALFAENRKAGVPNDQLFKTRAYLLDEEGIRMHVQGIIRGSEIKRYLWVEKLRKDFFLSRDERWPNADEIAHAYIGFSFAGPVALNQI